MGVEETLPDGIRILLGICIAMMCTMITGPPPHASLNSSTPNGGQENSERYSGGIGSVCPKSVVPSSDP